MREPARPRVRAVLVALLAASTATLAAEAEFPPTDVRAEFAVMRPSTGQMVSLVSGDRITHVVFFATWCPPCLDELPRLSDMEARWEDDGYALVLLAVPTRQSRDRLTSFVERREPPGTVLFDVYGGVAEKLGIDSLPFHVVLDGSGAELFRAPAVKRGVEEQIEGYLRTRR